MPFVDAREFVLTLGIKSRSEWFAYVNSHKPVRDPNAARLPLNPERSYSKSGWISWSDWLGCDIDDSKRVQKKSRRFREFKSAREFAHSLNLHGSLEWPKYLHGDFPQKPTLPADVPRNPRNVYPTEWRGWGDWLGTGNLAPFQRRFLPFHEARTFARLLGLKNGAAWAAWCRVRGNPPADIPRHPATIYKEKGWISWPDFLQPPA